MQNDPHARARILLDQAQAISKEEERWLNAHTAECPECTRHAELSSRALQAMDSLAFELDPAAAMRVQNAIRNRADLLASAESDCRTFWGTAALALFLAVAGSLAMWHPAAWLAARWGVPGTVWHAAFTLCWLLPSVLAALVPLFRSKLKGETS